MAKQAFYEELRSMVTQLREMGERYEKVRDQLVPPPPSKVSKDLGNLASCIHKGRTAIIRGIETTLEKPTVREYLGHSERRVLVAEVLRLRALLKECEDAETAEAGADNVPAGDADAVVPPS